MKQETAPKPKYFIYARKSTERDERQAHSIPDQLDTIRRLAEQQSLVVVDEFTESRTARKPGRKVFSEMLERIKEGEANAILAWTPDRLARNALDAGTILQLLDSGILQTLTFANFGFENTSSGKLTLGMAFVQSKYYTDSLSDVVRRGLQSKANRGMYPNGAKIGYALDSSTKELLPAPKTHGLVTRMFELYATGDYSLARLADEMFRRGLFNRSGGPFVRAQMVKMLTDPFYYGAFRWSGELYTGIHKPAVSKSLWDKAQEVYRQRSRPHSRKTERYPFNNFIRCGECGYSVTGEEHTRTQKNGHFNRWVYYRCTKKGKGRRCAQPGIREEDLLAQFEAVLRQIALPDDWAVPMLEQIDAWAVSEESHERARLLAIDGELKKIEAKLRRLTDLVIEGDLDRAEYRRRKEVLIGEKAAKFEARKLIARKGAKYWLEPLRELVNAVWERNLPTAGGDLSELRRLVAKVGSNLCLNSRNLLWDWGNPYALLAERSGCMNWSGRRDSNSRPLAPKASALDRAALRPDNGHFSITSHESSPNGAAGVADIIASSFEGSKRLEADVMRFIALFVVLVLMTASTCAKNDGESAAVGVSPGPSSSLPDGSKGQQTSPLTKESDRIEILSPKLPAVESEIATLWPEYLPPVEASEKWEFATAAKSEDGKHAGKAYYTSDSTHKIMEVFRTTLVARGFGAQQVEDPNYFGRMDFSDGETIIVVCVRHNNDKGKNAVEITIHKA